MYTQMTANKYFRNNENNKCNAGWLKCTPRCNTYKIAYQCFSNKNKEKTKKCTPMRTLISFIFKTKQEITFTPARIPKLSGGGIYPCPNPESFGRRDLPLSESRIIREAGLPES